MHRLTSQLKSLFRFAGPRGRSQDEFGRLFHDFREVLDRNNRSLEVITEMGDTLGGDYLFDIQYVRRSYGELSAAVQESVNGFDTLTRGRYPRLRQRFMEIDAHIRRVIDETVPMPDALVLFYEQVSGDMSAALGGKNNNLAEIKNALHLHVPDAFAVTTRAFDAFMRQNGIFDPSQDEGFAAEPSLPEVQERVRKGALPPELSRAIEKAVRKIKSRCGAGCTLAVRSSAVEEDGEFSFAGQFETVLNVPLETAAVDKAYREVVASLFSEKAAAYRRRMGHDIRSMKMAVACVAMVPALTSGVVYTSDPQGDPGTMVINAAWGLGTAIVEGETDADLFRVKKGDPPELIEERTGAKDTMVVMGNEGVTSVATPEDKRSRPSLSRTQVTELASLALRVEQHFKGPQDIEWALDSRGEPYILQSRPLRLSHETARPADAVPGPPAARIVLRNRGLAVYKGAAAGRVFILKQDSELDAIPRGAVLVARHDSSHFVRVMTGVSAIITDSGTPTSHMATLCREFKIPTVVNAGNATQVLSQGQEITVQVDGDGATLYQGLAKPVLERAQDDSVRLEELLEFRKKRYLLRYIAPLNLVDPLRDEFTPRACRTMHDILRFIHEKAVAALIEGAERGVKAGAVKLDLPIPADILLIDIGGGLDNPQGKKQVAAEQVTSLPLRAIITGMTRPGLWRSDAVPLKVNDFMASMLRVPDITTETGGRVEANMAVISREYANISLKFGYHFIILDCYCSENTRNNHIYFRFAGGATDMTKRSRRLQLLAAILGAYGFNIKTKGDLIVARLANVPQADAEGLLDQMGRLFSYTRQLDAVLYDDAAVDRYARDFLDGVYDF